MNFINIVLNCTVSPAISSLTVACHFKVLMVMMVEMVALDKRVSLDLVEDPDPKENLAAEEATV